MRKKRLVNVLTSAVLTAALVMSMGMTAMAENLYDLESDAVTVTKTVSADENVLYPEATYSFTIAAATVEAGTVVTDQDENTLPVYSVEDGAYFAKDATAGTDDSEIEWTSEDSEKESDTTNISFDTDKFTKPGIYRYTITENAEGLPSGVESDNTEYTLDVYVGYNDDGTALEIKGVVAYKNGKKVDEIEFTNTYATNSITITKVVTGNAGDKGHEYEFTITVTSGEEGNTTEQYATSDANVTLETGKPSTISLGNNDSITIYGLSEDDVYTIIESDDLVKNGVYSVSYKINDAEEATEVTVDEDTGATVANENTLSTTTSITVINDAEITTPTGIILNFAPYILLVAFAGVFAVLFLGKKREEI